MEKKISIIIPCYNVGEYLERSWEALKKQSIGIGELECIFVNDASTDDGHTINKLMEIEKEAPESVIIVDLDKNSGPGGARNAGIQYAQGEYIQFFDADDELRQDACELLCKTAKENDADIIQFNHLYVLGDESRSSRSSTENKNYVIRTKEDRIQFLDASLVTYGCTNKLYRTSLIHEVGARFPEIVRYEEPLFVYPLFLYAKSVFLLDEDLYIYRFREGSTVTSSLGKRVLEHPQVQLMLLEDCMARGDVFIEYRDIIAIYFLWSFYCETISYCGNYKNAVLPLDYFAGMQKICREIFPGWRQNPYIWKIPKGGMIILESIDRSFDSQKDLDYFVEESKALI